jgi:hypothetical protein
MNRIVERFARLKREGKKGFIVYIGAGDPDLEATRRLALAFDQAGVDVLELGVPFSDPLADGLVNQLAAQRFANSDRPLHLLQPHPSRRLGAIHQNCGEGGCGRAARAGFAAGGIG